MKEFLVPPLLLISCFGCITVAEKSDVEKTHLALGLLKIFDDDYKVALSNSTHDRRLVIHANFQSSASVCLIRGPDIIMSKEEVKRYFRSFCSANYELHQSTVGSIFSNVFVQYSAIYAILSFRICQIYYLNAFAEPNEERAADCAKIASYFNIFRDIVVAERLDEIEKIYDMALLNVTAKEEADIISHQRNKSAMALTILNQKYHLMRLHSLLSNFSDLTDYIHLQKAPTGSCHITSNRRCAVNEAEKSSFDLFSDFFTNGDMVKRDKDNAPPKPRHSIKDAYKRKFAIADESFIRDEAFKKYYYKEAWDNLFFIFHEYLCPMANYFNKAIYDDRVTPYSGSNYSHFIPPMQQSLRVWEHASELRRIIESEISDDGSKIVKILEKIQLVTGPDDFESKLQQMKESRLAEEEEWDQDSSAFDEVKIHFTDSEHEDEVDFIVDSELCE